MMATVTGWFKTRRGLAVSLVSAGMGMAPVTMSPLAARLAESHDWRGVLSIMAGIVLAVTLPLALLLRRPPAEVVQAADAPDAGMTLGQAVRSPQFLVLVATNFFCCATHSGPIFHTVSYAQLCGIGALAAVSIYSVEGLAGMGGRIGFGVMGDRFGAKRVLVAGLLAQAFGAMGYFFARELAAVLCRGRDVRLYLCRDHAAVCGAGAREFPDEDDGDDHGRHGDGGKPWHGDRAGAGRAGSMTRPGAMARSISAAGCWGWRDLPPR